MRRKKEKKKMIHSPVSKKYQESKLGRNMKQHYETIKAKGPKYFGISN
jgi:hypothetical protein